MRTVKLYTNLSEKEVMAKSITNRGSFDCVFKHENDVLHPIIELNVPSDTIYNELLKYCNYCYIEDYHRYYYCSVTSVRNNILMIECSEVDVLMSWASYIKGLEAIIERNEKEYNLDINDGVLKTFQYDQISRYAFPNKSALSYNEFVLAVAGGGGTV